MIWVKKQPFSKQGINNPSKFMNYSKDGLFKGQTLRKAFFKIVFKNTVKSDSFMCHKPDNSSQMFISSFREFAFPFKLTRFIDTRINTHKGNKFFITSKVFDIAYFGQKLNSCGFSNAFDRGKNFKVIGNKLLSKFMDNFINFFKFLREENKGRNCLREDELFGFTLRGNRVFCQADNLLSRDKWFSAFRGIKERGNFIYTTPFDCMSRGIRLKQIQDRFREWIYMIRQFWESDKKELFNVIFQFSNLTANIFSFSCQISELLRRRGAKAFIQRLMIVKKERSNGKGIFFISFGLSNKEFSVIRDNKGIKEQGFKFSIMEEGKQRDVVEARGLHSNEDRVFGVRFKGSKEFGEAAIIHGSGEQEEFFSRAIKATGGKGAFGDVNTNKDGFHCFFTSFLVVLGVKGSRCASRPILHDDKGLKSPTNLSWIREAGNRLLKGLYGPKEMEFSCLAPILLLIIYFILVSIKIT